MGTEVSVPNNAVYVGGPIKRRSKRVKTVTNVRRGCLVIRDTDDDHFKVAGAAALNPLGWCDKDSFGTTTGTGLGWDGESDPVTESSIPVIHGPGVNVAVRLVAGGSVLDGAALYGAANGEVTGTPGAGPIVAYALMTYDNSAGGSAARIVAQSAI